MKKIIKQIKAEVKSLRRANYFSPFQNLSVMIMPPFYPMPNQGVPVMNAGFANNMQVPANMLDMPNLVGQMMTNQFVGSVPVSAQSNASKVVTQHVSASSTISV